MMEMVICCNFLVISCSICKLDSYKPGGKKDTVFMKTKVKDVKSYLLTHVSLLIFITFSHRIYKQEVMFAWPNIFDCKGDFLLVCEKS